MREIKFRGKAKCGDWAYGNLVKIPNEILIVTSVPFAFKEKDPEHWKIMEYNGIKNSITVYCVLSKTVGEFTDLQDSEGVDVFEGDIIQNADHLKEIYEVAMIDGAFRILAEGFKGEDLYWTLKHDNFKVIGNINDNPDLLEEGD